MIRNIDHDTGQIDQGTLWSRHDGESHVKYLDILSQRYHVMDICTAYKTAVRPQNSTEIG